MEITLTLGTLEGFFFFSYDIFETERIVVPTAFTLFIVSF